MPVFPAVASTIVPPGLRLPSASARRMIPLAARSFTLPPGIQVFQLGEDAGGIAGNQLLQLQDGSVADQLGNVVSDAQAIAFDGFCPHPTGYGSGSGASIGECSTWHLALSTL